MTEVLGGYYDDGIKDGKTRMVPSLTFRLHNSSDQLVGPVQLTVSFWQEGAPLVQAKPIPDFYPTRWVSRADGVVV